MVIAQNRCRHWVWLFLASALPGSVVAAETKGDPNGPEAEPAAPDTQSATQPATQPAIQPTIQPAIQPTTPPDIQKLLSVGPIVHDEESAPWQETSLHPESDVGIDGKKRVVMPEKTEQSLLDSPAMFNPGKGLGFLGAGLALCLTSAVLARAGYTCSASSPCTVGSAGYYLLALAPAAAGVTFAILGFGELSKVGAGRSSASLPLVLAPLAAAADSAPLKGVAMTAAF